MVRRPIPEKWQPEPGEPAPRALEEIRASLPAVQAAAREAGLFAGLLSELPPWLVRFWRPGDPDVLVEFDPAGRRARVGGGPWRSCRDWAVALAAAVARKAELEGGGQDRPV